VTPEEQRRLTARFLESFNHPDPKVFEEMVTDDFRFEMVSAIKDYPPMRGKQYFAATETATLKSLFPNGLNLKLGTIICEGPHASVLATCDTVVANGRRYVQRYHFYLRFEGDKVAEALEFNDTDLVRQIFLT
jgi:ketosteroid isomerase-like protein